MVKVEQYRAYST